MAIALHRDTRRRRAVWLVAAALVAIASAAVSAAVLEWRAEDAGKPSSAVPARPELQRILEELVTGPDRIAPGAAAYVSGPHGTWTGASGIADRATGEPVEPETRFRLASVSKAWTAALVLDLAEEGRLRLDDTVARHLPGVLPYGDRITVRQLLDHTSGMVDTNDIGRDPGRYLARVRSPEVRARFVAVARRLRREPGYEFSPRLWVDLAAALPLEYPPGTTYHYSNIAYTVAGLLAERVGGAELATLFRRRITEPLGLRRVAYDPHSRIRGPHARGYLVAADGTLTDTTTHTAGIGAGGAMVSDAADEARFLVALMRGRVVGPEQLRELRTPSRHQDYGLGLAIRDTRCGGTTYGHAGGLDGFTTQVAVSERGDRVVVLLLNGRTVADGPASNRGDMEAYTALAQLYCAA